MYLYIFIWFFWVVGNFLKIAIHVCCCCCCCCLFLFGFMAGAELIEPGYHMENGQAKNQIEIKKENNQNNISSIERERERERGREGERWLKQ